MDVFLGRGLFVFGVFAVFAVFIWKIFSPQILIYINYLRTAHIEQVIEFNHVIHRALGVPELALSGAGGGTTTNNNNKTTNLGGVHITINGYNAKNDDELAKMVADKINDMLDEDEAVFK